MEIRDIAGKYGLSRNDLFKHPKFGFILVTRGGIEKIQAKENIKVDYTLVQLSDDHKHVVFQATARSGTHEIVTYGEVNPKNCTNQYPIATAEKRALSRAVLKICGLYAHGIMGEDEMELDSNTTASSQTGSSSSTPKALPKLDKTRFKKALDAIKNGKADAVKKQMSNYDLTEEQSNLLKLALGGND